MTLPKTPSKGLHIASMICALHCIITPIIIVFVPFTTHIIDNIFVEMLVLIASILFIIIIIYKGYCRHKRLQSSILFGIGALFWVMHTVFEDHRFILSISYLLIGTACVCGSYYLNHRHIKCCQPASCD